MFFILAPFFKQIRLNQTYVETFGNSFKQLFWRRNFEDKDWSQSSTKKNPRKLRFQNLSPGRNASKRPVSTLPKTNIVPENQRLEDEISCNDGLFQGLC